MGWLTLTPEHIPEVVSLSRQASALEHEGRHRERGHRFRLIIVGCVFVLALVSALLLTGNASMVDHLLVPIVGIVGQRSAGGVSQSGDAPEVSVTTVEPG